MSKEGYEKPSIVRHTIGTMNEFGRPSGQKRCEEIDGISVEQLIKDYGSPLVVFSEATIRKKHAQLQRAFELRYPKVQIAWSYKTNYQKAICAVMHDEGSWAEVVSEHEYEMAGNLGITGEKIIYNGPDKPESSLIKAVREGAIINIDNLDEVYLLEKIAEAFNRTIDVGIRINMDTGMYPAWDRFGFNLENGQASEVAERIMSGGKLKLTGFHFHIGTFILEPRFYGQAVLNICGFALKMKEKHQLSIKYIDIGGGFASKNRLKSTYLPTTDLAPDFDAFAEAICSILLGSFPKDNLPILFLETGRAVIDEAGYLITTVEATKRLPSGLRALVLDAGVNIMVTSFWYDLEMLPVKEKSNFMEDHVVFGPLCMQIDVIRDIVKLPILSKGDNLVIRPFGAYNTTQWMQFIKMRPAIVMIGMLREVDVIREAEDVTYLHQKDRLPERFLRQIKAEKPKVLSPQLKVLKI
ncbi:MAG: diaminopimelate decarboxylase [Desulfobacterales bacterium RIFOXYA12_FULL_46_15]|nr:MAG: diaminopimelate decarboxylase [Desulfobacula sp. GWF2_41_7]OGR26343.1 MAG: diaminopimelate decarboxylase [Desulfobacterales bacterium RIFOXYA12_FULL_46_15]